MRLDMIHNVPQVPTGEVPCYCYQCLKNSISKVASNYSSICYNYVLPTKNPKGRYNLNKDKRNTLRYFGSGENTSVCGFVDKKKALNKGVKLNCIECMENAEGEIDYYNYRMEKKEHIIMLDQISKKFMKNLIDCYLSESIMPNLVDLSSQKSLCENENIPESLKFCETDGTYSLSSSTSSSISKSDTRSSTSCSLKLKDKKSGEIDYISDQEMGLAKLFPSSNCLNEFPVIAGNEECSKIFALKNSNAEVSNDSTVSPDYDSPSDQSMKTYELKVREEEASSNTNNFVCENSPVVKSRHNLQIYTLLFSDETKTHLDEHNTFSYTSSQETFSTNFRKSEISFPACRSEVDSKECDKSGIDSSVHGIASNSEGEYKPFVIKELWRPLTFSSNNNVKTKSRTQKMKNKEGMLIRNGNENLRAKNRIKPTTALSQRVTISKKIDAKNGLENEVKRKDNRKNENGKRSSPSFKSQLNLNYTRSDKKSFCKEISSDTSTNKNENPKLKFQAKQAMPEEEVGNIKRKRKFDSSSRSKLADKVFEKCKGDFSPKSNSCNDEVSATVESPAKRRKSLKSLQNKSEKKKKNHVADVDGVKDCTKSVKKYRTVITRKLCFIKRKIYIQSKVQKWKAPL